jgi:hypothetical protein
MQAAISAAPETAQVIRQPLVQAETETCAPASPHRLLKGIYACCSTTSCVLHTEGNVIVLSFILVGRARTGKGCNPKGVLQLTITSPSHR